MSNKTELDKVIEIIERTKEPLSICLLISKEILKITFKEPVESKSELVNILLDYRKFYKKRGNNFESEITYKIREPWSKSK